MDIFVENIKCSGCAGTITKKLTAAFNPKNIQVNVETGAVSIDIDDSKKAKVIEVLHGLGYPQVNCVNGFEHAKAKAKSFVSCAIGKINQ